MDLPSLPTYAFEPNLAGLLSLALTILLPLVVALLLKASTPSWVKGVSLLALSGVKTVLEGWLAHTNSGEPVDLYRLVYMVLINFGIAVAAYFGLLKSAATRLSGYGNKDRVIEGETL